MVVDDTMEMNVVVCFGSPSTSRFPDGYPKRYLDPFGFLFCFFDIWVFFRFSCPFLIFCLWVNRRFI